MPAKKKPKPQKNPRPVDRLKIEGSWETVAVKMLNTPAKAPPRKTVKRKRSPKKK